LNRTSVHDRAMSRPTEERNQEATVYIGNLDERCTEALIWELMLQAGPVGKCTRSTALDGNGQNANSSSLLF